MDVAEPCFEKYLLFTCIESICKLWRPQNNSEKPEKSALSKSPGNVSVIIVAGGKGSRFGSQEKKQFILLKGHPILCWTIWRFHQFNWIYEIILVIPKGLHDFVESRIILPYHFDRVRKIVAGGAERQDSVFAGLNAVDPRSQFVCIHDGVRPFVSNKSLSRIYQTVQKYGTAVLGFPSRDTVKRVENNIVTNTEDRSKLWLIQTPQVFKYDLIMAAHKKAIGEKYYATDDARLAERLGIPVHLVKGDYPNMKITNPSDLKIAEYFLPLYFSEKTFSDLKIRSDF